MCVRPVGSGSECPRGSIPHGLISHGLISHGLCLYGSPQWEPSMGAHGHGILPHESLERPPYERSPSTFDFSRAREEKGISKIAFERFHRVPPRFTQFCPVRMGLDRDCPGSYGSVQIQTVPMGSNRALAVSYGSGRNSPVLAVPTPSRSGPRPCRRYAVFFPQECRTSAATFPPISRGFANPFPRACRAVPSSTARPHASAAPHT